MKSLDLAKIKEQVSKSITREDNGFVRINLFPHQLCLACGWDKPEYDAYFLKHCANTLEGVEKECFEALYLGIQVILAEMEALSMRVSQNTGKPLLNPQSCKITTELWNPISFSSKGSKQISQVDKLKKLKEQQEADENTPIKI